MFHQTTLVGEDLATVLAAEWFLPRVDLHVRLQVGGLVEGFAALHAAIRFLTRVHVNVLLQVTLIREEFSTVQTAEGLLSSVHAVVFLQTGRLTEAFAAERAVVRLLTRVDTLMQDQGTGVGEVFPTVFTHHEPVGFKRASMGLGDDSLVSVVEVTFRKRRIINRADLGAIRTRGISVQEIIMNGHSCTDVCSRVREAV